MRNHLVPPSTLNMVDGKICSAIYFILTAADWIQAQHCLAKKKIILPDFFDKSCLKNQLKSGQVVPTGPPMERIMVDSAGISQNSIYVLPALLFVYFRGSGSYFLVSSKLNLAR